ncbi:MAG: TonB-dependent receptor plug domain-containing protein, partial [Bdellovibrionales bacterium]|nr:TonB-dependent receptor plug domain-containing protein [Bdellovibrionales bacterium]
MTKASLFFFFGSLVFSSLSYGQAVEEDPTLLPTVRVFGSDRSVLTETMSPGVVSKKVIRSQQITDVNRALKQASGVYVREEEGEGLRANIGLRGTNPDRSKKVTLLEDGILVGPAPYSAPAAYYTPLMNHVDSLEVHRGFKATWIGPNSIGGAINYITLSAPDDIQTSIQSTYGSFGTWNSSLTQSQRTSFGSYLINGSYLKSDGFKELDGGGNTGFHKTDLMTKLQFNLPAPEDRFHSIEARFFYTNEDSKETYLGLSRSDSNSTPYRRYSASQLDEMKWDHRQFQIRHEFQPSTSSLIQSDIYHHEFHRAWYRLDRFRGSTTPSLDRLLKHPNDGATNPILFSILKGDLDSSSLGGTDGQLEMARNDRRYFSQGVQSKWTSEYNFSDLQLKPWVFLRFHRDQIKRNHTADNYEMTQKKMVRTSDPSRVTALNREFSEARTLSAGFDFSFYDFILTQVARYENIDFEYENSLTPTSNNKRISEVFLPGISLLKKWGDSGSTRASYNEAATISGLSADGSEVKEEAS